MKYHLLSNRTYDVLKWVGLLLLPALGVFYGTVAPLWGFPAPDAVVKTLDALGTLLGVIIGVDSITATTEGEAC